MVDRFLLLSFLHFLSNSYLMRKASVLVPLRNPCIVENQAEENVYEEYASTLFGTESVVMALRAIRWELRVLFVRGRGLSPFLDFSVQASVESVLERTPSNHGPATGRPCK